ncbi:MAG: glycosyltransferase [Proteobacteria bacterium]|nr:glycosyltransferase [Pseudomonadota bacterium]
MDPSQVPVLINCFNQPTYLRMMLDQLSRLGCRNLVVVDQASTYPPLVRLLAEIEREVTVIRLRDNNGPHWLFTSGFSSMLPEYFIYTDPDIQFPADMPRSLIRDLMRVSRAASATKVGLALDISRPENIKRVGLPIGESVYTIPEWERQFWRRPIRFRGFEVYKAPVDTTFALYHRARFDEHVRNFRAENVYYCMDMPGSYRLAGRYTSIHLPWMLDDPIPEEELAHYVAHRRNVHEYLG